MKIARFPHSILLRYRKGHEFQIVANLSNLSESQKSTTDNIGSTHYKASANLNARNNAWRKHGTIHLSQFRFEMRKQYLINITN